MSNPRGWKQRLATISRLWAEKDYDKAMSEVESLLKMWPGNAHLHILKASLIQLQDDPKYDLEEAKETLLRAAELDKGSPAAAIELGYFLDNVEDNPEAARKAYAEAVSCARNLLIDGLIGQAKAYLQLQQREESFRCLLEVLQLARFDADSKRTKVGGNGSNLLFESLASHFSAIQLKGPHAEQIQDLLNELVADRSE
jgi:hypothetical protein